MPNPENAPSEEGNEPDFFQRLVEKHGLKILDFPAFVDAMKIAFEVYQRDRGEANSNQQHDEIAKLYKAATKEDIGAVAVAIRDLSPQSRESLSKRGERIGICLPTPEDFSAANDQSGRCNEIAQLCRVGGGMVQGRNRPSGKKSLQWTVSLHAPDKRKTFTKRDAERSFIINLQLAWLEGTGTKAAVTANHEVPGPFTRFVKDCLEFAGVRGVDVVETLNSLTRDRKRPQADE